jgi:hypothetical protein
VKKVQMPFCSNKAALYHTASVIMQFFICVIRTPQSVMTTMYFTSLTVISFVCRLLDGSWLNVRVKAVCNERHHKWFKVLPQVHISESCWLQDTDLYQSPSALFLRYTKQKHIILWTQWEYIESLKHRSECIVRAQCRWAVLMQTDGPDPSII